MIEPLTSRESEILRLLADGLTNQAIADQLVLSTGTVKAHTNHIFGKLGVANRTQALLRAQERGLLDETPPQIPGQSHPDLPSDLTPFIGREKELDTLGALLHDARIRLVTVQGAGGMGKTRLAVEAARRHASLYPDGVRFVPLAQVTDPRNIAPAIIDSLGMAFQKTHDLWSALGSALSNKQMLLVLDNVEHLTSEAERLVELLENAPHLTLLVTSRERLHVSAEVLFVLGSMAYEAEPGDLLQTDAAQLLLQRARAIRPGLELGEADWPQVARICQLTQGMPLALVLAAGWLEMLTLTEIADELAQSINILESQMRDLPERQRSMRATITHSWNRLTPEEQRYFIRLSVFRGGFTREASRQVAGAELLALQTLVNRSFITFKAGRYEIHELLRQFGWEYLQRATHATEICTLHSAYYLRWIHQLAGDIEGNDQTEALKTISLNLDNMRLAWRWAVDTGQGDLIGQALDAFYNFFLLTGRLSEGIDVLQAAFEPWAGSDTPLLNRIRARLYSLLLMYQHEQLNEADLEACVRAAEAQGDDYELAIAVELLGSYASYVAHDYHRAIALQERALSLLEKHESWFHMAAVYHKLGYDHLQVTGMEALIEATEKAYQIARKTGNLFNLRAALGNLGSAAFYLGRYHEAEQYYRDAIDEADGTDRTLSRSQKIYFTHILFLQGKFDEGRALLADAWADTRGTLDINAVSFGYALHGFLAVIEGRYADGLAFSMESLREVRNDITGTLVANLSAGMAACGLGDTPAAERHLREAFQRSRQMNFFASATWGLPMLVIARAQQGQFEDAVRYAALLRSHPLSAKGWIDSWALLAETEANLRTTLDEPTFRQAQAQGQGLQLEAVVAEIIGEAENAGSAEAG